MLVTQSSGHPALPSRTSCQTSVVRPSPSTTRPRSAGAIAVSATGTPSAVHAGRPAASTRWARRPAPSRSAHAITTPPAGAGDMASAPESAARATITTAPGAWPSAASRCRTIGPSPPSSVRVANATRIPPPASPAAARLPATAAPADASRRPVSPQAAAPLGSRRCTTSVQHVAASPASHASSAPPAPSATRAKDAPAPALPTTETSVHRGVPSTAKRWTRTPATPPASSHATSTPPAPSAASRGATTDDPARRPELGQRFAPSAATCRTTIAPPASRQATNAPPAPSGSRTGASRRIARASSLAPEGAPSVETPGVTSRPPIRRRRAPRPRTPTRAEREARIAVTSSPPPSSGPAGDLASGRREDLAPGRALAGPARQTGPAASRRNAYLIVSLKLLAAAPNALPSYFLGSSSVPNMVSSALLAAGSALAPGAFE